MSKISSQVISKGNASHLLGLMSTLRLPYLIGSGREWATEMIWRTFTGSPPRALSSPKSVACESQIAWNHEIKLFKCTKDLYQRLVSAQNLKNCLWDNNKPKCYCFSDQIYYFVPFPVNWHLNRNTRKYFTPSNKSGENQGFGKIQSSFIRHHRFSLDVSIVPQSVDHGYLFHLTPVGLPEMVYDWNQRLLRWYLKLCL